MHLALSEAFKPKETKVDLLSNNNTPELLRKPHCIDPFGSTNSRLSQLSFSIRPHNHEMGPNNIIYNRIRIIKQKNY